MRQSDRQSKQARLEVLLGWCQTMRSRVLSSPEARAKMRLAEELELRGVDPTVIGDDALEAYATLALIVARGAATTREQSFRSARDGRLREMADQIADVLAGRRPLNRSIDGLLVAHAPFAAIPAALKRLSQSRSEIRKWPTPVFSALLIADRRNASSAKA